MRFMAACGGDSELLRTVDLYSSHEALLLDYEYPLIRVDSRTGSLYDVSAHMIWIGERTRQLDGAHVELFSKVRNPLGVKLGPTTTVEDAVAARDQAQPGERARPADLHHADGRLEDPRGLPRIVEGVTAAGVDVLWVCDPMHGNTFEAPSGYKTRRFDDVIDEIRGFFDVHRGLGTVPGGLHIELTGDDVTECLGGSEKIDDADLATRYETLCDPRLNHQQSLETAFLVAEMLAE